jgi:hypothetical protein
MAVGFGYSRRPMSTPELEAEQEVDFAKLWRALVQHWWLPAVGLVAGAVIGALVTVGHTTSWKATSQVYLGQALVGGSLAQLAPTSITLASNAVTSGQTIRAVAAQLGIPTAKLSGHVSTSPVFGETGTKVGAPTPIMAITVSGLPRHAALAAADALAQAAVVDVARFETSKLGTLRQHLAFDNAQIKAVNDRLASARAVQAQVLADKTLSSTDRLLGVVSQNAVITQALTQQIALVQDSFAVQQSITLAQDIGTARVLTLASAHGSPGASRRTAVAIGAFIGLILGIIAALVWEPLVARRRQPATA